MSNKEKPFGERFLKFLERLIKSEKDERTDKGGDEKTFTKFHWVLVLGSVGLAIMIVSSFFTAEKEVMPLTDPMDQTTIETSVLPRELKTMADYERKFEDDLEKMLKEMIGVSEVLVMVNLDSSEELIFAENVNDSSQVTDERDQQGGTRKVNDATRDTQIVLSSENPIVIKTLKPKVRGVYVVAKGAENPQVKTMIIEAVQRVLDVSYHNISVQPKK